MRYSTHVMIKNREISISNPTYFIADVAANHDGDLGRAKDLIYRAKDAGLDAVKFQHFTANKIVSDRGFKMLCQTLLNIGFCQPHFYYPYINTPYSSYIKDHALFLLRMLGIKTKFAFWGNMMECYAQKPLLN